MARREYTAGSPTTLASALAAGAGSFNIVSDTNWPTSADYDFFVTIDGGTAQEERILCSARTGTTVTVATGGRGKDGTGDKAHAVGATVWPSWSAQDADEANAHIESTGYTSFSKSVHGLGSGDGVVVGTDKPQTLTAKTLTTPKINEAINLTATSTELNILDGATLSTAELNYVDGVTSAIQTQLDAKAPLANPTFTGTVTLPALGNGLAPVGSITMWAGTAASPPTGWLVCNGQSTASYPALAAIVGATVPDMQGLVPVGWKSGDDAFGTLKGTGGSKTSTAAHTHGIDHDHGAFTTTGGEGNHSHTVQHDYENAPTDIAGTGSALWDDLPGNAYYSGTSTNGAHNHSIDVPAFTGTSLGSSVGATNGNLQPYFTLNFIIKT